MLFSASSHYANDIFGDHTYFFNKHALRIFIGIVFLFGLSFFDYRNLKYIATLLLIISFLIVTIAHFTSESKTARWLIIGGKTLFTTSVLANTWEEKIITNVIKDVNLNIMKYYKNKRKGPEIFCIYFYSIVAIESQSSRN